MHIRIYGETSGLKWRGGALIEFDGKRWSNTNQPRDRVPVQRGETYLIPPGEWPNTRNLNYDVEYEDIGTSALFFAGTPITVSLRESILFRKGDGSYQLGHSPRQGFRYSSYSILEGIPERSPAVVPPPVLPLKARERYLQLPAIDPRIPELARSFAAGSIRDLERVRAIERRLRSDYGYTLELLSREVPDPLAHFLFTRRKGHCEYFASAMTVMLRAIGIPARMATGFQSGVYNSITDLWLIRASDAHTWVEAWIPGHGWATFDPTPPDPNPPQFTLFSRLALYIDAAETFWRQWVVGYDASQQVSLADRMEQGARRAGVRWFDWVDVLRTQWSVRLASLGSGALRWGFALLALVCLAAIAPRLLRLLRLQRRVQAARRGHASVGDATLLYQKMLQIVKRHGYQKPAWFTPAEFAASLPAGWLGTTVGEFTAAYNALRFGGRTDVAPRLFLLLEELSRRGAS
jgi:protein-glutamine gamma-glutamyltransferase